MRIPKEASSNDFHAGRIPLKGVGRRPGVDEVVGFPLCGYPNYALRGPYKTSGEGLKPLLLILLRVLTEAGQTSAKRFQDAWDAFIKEESRSKDWTVATHRKYNAVRNRLKDFRATLSFNDMEEKTLNKWVEFLQKQPMPDGTVGMKNSTVYKYIQFLRVFLNWATRKGYNTKLDYQSFRPNLKQAHNQPIYISQEEIHQLMDFKAPKGQERLEKIRDLFIFSYEALYGHCR